MVKTKFKKAVSLMLAAVMSLTAFMGIGATTAFAAVGEKADVYLVDYPRSGDTNNNGEWGHGNLNYMNGWKGLSTKYTGLRAMGSYSGNIAYCIEPGTGQRTGDTLTEKDENFFNNISPNGTISGDDIRLLIGRILQYGYRGGISTSWKSQNESDANCIAHAYATQILIWETIVGERDAGFNHVSTGGYNAVLECVSSAHPLRSKILSYYNSMVTSVQNHTKVPSFCTRSSGSAKVNELEWNGSKYVAMPCIWSLSETACHIWLWHDWGWTQTRFILPMTLPGFQASIHRKFSMRWALLQATLLKWRCSLSAEQSARSARKIA